MMRRSLAACLGACLLFGTLALAPDDAAAWLINQPRFEKQLVTEGDPDGPDLIAPQPGVGEESNSNASGTQSAAELLMTLVERIVVVLNGQ